MLLSAGHQARFIVRWGGQGSRSISDQRKDAALLGLYELTRRLSIKRITVQGVTKFVHGAHEWYGRNNTPIAGYPLIRIVELGFVLTRHDVELVRADIANGKILYIASSG